MSTESMPGHEDVEAAEVEAAISWELGDLADSVEAGPVPYDRLLAGGQRRLRRRRLLTAALGAALVVAVGGTGAVLGGSGHRASSAVAPAASGVSPTASASPSGNATPVAGAATPVSAAASAVAGAASAGPTRDPFTPTRVKAGEGTVNGHTLEAWIALWPAAPTADDGLKQDKLIWEERHAADPVLSSSDQPNPDARWDPHMDRSDVYLTVDGKRQPGDHVQSIPAPGGTEKDPSPAIISGEVLNRVVGAVGIPDMVVVRVRPDVARVVVTWKNGGSVDAVPVAVGDSTSRWYAVVRKPGSSDNAATSYAADGSVLRTQTTWW
ncbi:hypothetical protein [Streptomyces sp. CBMA123]|uniref:hypothetical protein n=1 Tax=Streptomyces sp. CBMA123 TaxID=1896313 RepID=UPI001661EFA0|nr:hypothetical protein [Streptomyces sp. CBMA123]MBD0695363.1 hypothetical protein [Streptomyces sp. CBMA123]